jgi:UDP-glucose 4-epimerase
MRERRWRSFSASCNWPAAYFKTFSEVTGRKIAYRIAARRSGDVAECYADASLAYRLMGWRATRTVEDMCTDAWRWQKTNVPVK